MRDRPATAESTQTPTPSSAPLINRTGESEPKTDRGHRMKAKLLRAARRVYARDGFAAARIVDIVAEAEASAGTFYRYFDDKHAALMALLEGLFADFYHLSRSPWQSSNPTLSIFITTRRYFEVYRDNGDLMKLLLEVAQTDDEVRDLWNRSRARFLGRIELALTRGQEEGVIRKPLDCKLCASLLGGMTEQFAYMSFVLRLEPDRSLDEITEAVVDLWTRATFVSPSSEPAAQGGTT